jgi:hypothetical protein
VRKALLIGLIVLLAGALGAWIVVRQTLGSDMVRAALERQLADRLDQPVHIGSATASLFPRIAVDLHDVAIGQPPSAQVGRLQVVTGARGLFSRRIADAELIHRDAEPSRRLRRPRRRDAPRAGQRAAAPRHRFPRRPVQEEDNPAIRKMTVASAE